MADPRRFYESTLAGARRSSPSAQRNREAIANVLSEWLSKTGVVLEIASGTGEHAMFFARRFPSLQWQPSDVDTDALQSISAWHDAARLPNVRQPVCLDASSSDWPTAAIDVLSSVAVSPNGCEPGTIIDSVFSAVLSINMVHISPWSASLGLLDGSAKLLQTGGPLILYGPWLKADVPTAASNLAFDQQLRERDPRWGLRDVDVFEAEAEKRGFKLEQVRTMPANNFMLLFRLGG